MRRDYPNLSKPITLAGKTFRNRMFSAPMGGTDIKADGRIGRMSTAFYELRAKGGAGAVTVSECMVHPSDGSHAFRLDLSVPGSLASFTYTADAIRRHGSIPVVELSHSGQYAGTYLVDKEKKFGLNQWGPSDTVRPDGCEVKALDQAMINDIVEAYGNVAGLAKRAGFEMIMVHAGHGWLINQFLSPYFNHRSDRYGGSLENRVRLVQEVLDSVRAAVGPALPIEVRLSGSELFDGGYDLDEGVRIAQLIESRVDMLHVSAGTYQRGFGLTHPSMFEAHGRNVYLAAEIKKHVSIPVSTVGGLNDPEQMETIIASGQADVVHMARALLADPYLPRKVMENRSDEIVHCIRCFTCMAERAATTTRRCTVNPLIGRELDGSQVIPARKRRKVLVAGAGPGGLQAALTAAKRGHEVVLCEASDGVGGLLKGEQAISFKTEAYDLVCTLKRLCEKEGVDIRLNTRVTAELAGSEAPDALIIAVGSSPIVPPLPGIDSEKVVGVCDYYLDPGRIGQTVAVLGGGLAGCEMAVELGRQGKKVTLVEALGELAIDSNVRHRPLLLEQIDRLVDTVHLETFGEAINEEGMVCRSDSGEKFTVPADSVIIAVGMRSNREMVDELQGSAPYIAQIGDCVEPSTITQAIYQGHWAALDIQ